MKDCEMTVSDFKIVLRRAAANLLAEKGFVVEERTGKGIRPGARLTAKPPQGPAVDVAVRTGRERSLGFSRLRDGNFRTLQNVRLVLAVVPDDKSGGGFVVLAFESKVLKRWFGKALNELEQAGRAPELDLPIFIPLDAQSKKNLGHQIVGLKKAALWSARIEPKQLEEQKMAGESESFIDRVKREFAERNEVEVSRVRVEFRILES
jgi:hypothetical protein